MGKRGKEIIGIDADDLVEKLNKALADEWLAYYQYWVGSKVLVGPMRGEVEVELIEHANDELRHADMLAERIITLGGTPVLDPSAWQKITNCGYAPPENPAVPIVLDQNIEAERCAIDVYVDIMKMTEGKDHVTWEMARQIMTDEIEHEEDLEALQEDIEVLKQSM